jgi:hypothetical protein
LNILKKRGDRVVIISKKGKKSETVINVLKALDVACSSDNFRFPVSGRNGEIILPALKVEGKDGVFYMVDYEIDGEIYGLLREKWGIEVVGY